MFQRRVVLESTRKATMYFCRYGGGLPVQSCLFQTGDSQRGSLPFEITHMHEHITRNMIHKALPYKFGFLDGDNHLTVQHLV